MSELKKSHTYRGLDLASDTLDTLILSGGGIFGVLYIGLIQFLETIKIKHRFKNIYGVSVGSLFATLITLGYTSDDINTLLKTDIDIHKILSVNADNILNIIDKLGVNDGAYIESVIKKIFIAKGFSPYITFKDLYLATHINLNIGYTSNFLNKFIMANYDTMPNMQVCVAIRASIAIPLLLTPVVDYESLDLLYDGGIINNNPIKHYLLDWWSSQDTHIPTGHTRDIACQCNLDVASADDTPTIANIPTVPFSETPLPRHSSVSMVPISLTRPETPLPKKYTQDFWCIDIKVARYSRITTADQLDKVTFIEYINGIISKIFHNQDSNRDKYTQLSQVIDCQLYTDINPMNSNITPEQIEMLINDGYHKFNTYYHTELLH